MRALVQSGYGDPADVLQTREVEEPTPAADEVVVRVGAAAVNPGDVSLLSGTPYVFRPMVGLRGPKHPILGLAVAGTVGELGAGVTRLQMGDRVVAEVPYGGFSEAVAVSTRATARMPATVAFDQAAALPVSGVTALQALRDIAAVRPQQRVLVNGASGGVGTFAVQIAKTFGAEVTGVCSTRNVDLVRSIGADHVIDYNRDDVTDPTDRYDVILDNVGNRALTDLRRALAPRGTLIPNSNSGGTPWLGGYLPRAAQALAVSPFVDQRLRPFSATSGARDLTVLAALLDRGVVSAVVDQVFSLDEGADALAYFSHGHARGKVVVRVL